MADDTGGLTRRGLVAAVGGAGVGGTAGVLYFGDVLGGGGGGTTQITAQEPNDDSEASLGELRYLIESYEDSEYTVDVTSFTYDGGVIDVRYESAAADRSGHDRWRRHLGELGHVAWAFGLYVQSDGPNLEWNTGTSEESGTANDGTGTATSDRPTTVSGATEPGDGEVKGTRLTARIENPYSVEEGSETPEQPSSYGIERRWIRNWIAGAWTEERLINRIANTRVGTETASE